MSENIGTAADPILVPVRLADGMLDLLARAEDAAAMQSAIRWAELEYHNPDPDQFHGEWVRAKGVHISYLPPVIITPGVLNADGTERTAPVTDSRPHVNIRITEPALSRVDEHGVLKWQKWVMAWALGGEADAHANKGEAGRTLFGVTLIDPATITTPARWWF